MAEFQPFQLEGMVSEWENAVGYNRSESGAQPAMLSDLLGDDLTMDDLPATELNYAQVDRCLQPE